MTTERSSDHVLEAAPSLLDRDLWVAVHTHPRAEKVVARFLAKRKVPCFLPMSRSRRTYGARVRHSWIPLFPGYLFCGTDGADQAVVYRAKRVVRILVPTAPEALRADLENLARAIQAGPDLVRIGITEPGTPVEVVSGPFAGTRGTFVRRKGATLLVLRVHFVGYGAEVDIDEAHVRAIDSA